VSFASDDADRFDVAECRYAFGELRDFGGPGEQLPEYALQAAWRHFRDGVHIKPKLKKAVLKDCKREFKGLIAAALISLVVNFMVAALLRRLLAKPK
jgi:hypothetical protein